MSEVWGGVLLKSFATPVVPIMEVTFIQSSSWMRLLVRWLMRAWQTAEGHIVWLVVRKNVWQGEVWEQSAGGESHDHQLSLRLSSQVKGQRLLTGTAEKNDSIIDMLESILLD